MKSVIVFCLLSVAALAFARPEEQYTDRYDSVDVQKILHNDKLFDGYYNCVLGNGKCTVEGTELKTHIPDALENRCAKCTEVQKKNIDLVMRYLVNKKPEKWEQLSAKYDPEKKYTAKYEKELREIKA